MIKRSRVWEFIDKIKDGTENVPRSYTSLYDNTTGTVEHRHFPLVHMKKIKTTRYRIEYRNSTIGKFLHGNCIQLRLRPKNAQY